MQPTDTLDWLNLSGRIASRLKRTFPWVEWNELLSAAAIAAEQANSRYDETKAPNKNRVAYIHFKGYYLSIDILRSTKVVKRTARDFIIFNESDLKDTSKTGLESLEEVAITQERATPNCDDLLTGLTGQQKTLMKLKYEDDYTFEELGEFFGISNVSAFRRHRKALKKLRGLRGNLVDCYV